MHALSHTMLCLRQFFIDEGTCPHLHDEEHAGGLGLSKVRVIRIVWDHWTSARFMLTFYVLTGDVHAEHTAYIYRYVDIRLPHSHIVTTTH